MEWGCETKARVPIYLDGDPLYRCPRRPLLDHPSKFGRIFWLYRQMQNGYLPERGGLNDQPAKFVDYMTIIDRALDFCREEKEAREAAKRRTSGARRG